MEHVLGFVLQNERNHGTHWSVLCGYLTCSRCQYSLEYVATCRVSIIHISSNRLQVEYFCIAKPMFMPNQAIDNLAKCSTVPCLLSGHPSMS